MHRLDQPFTRRLRVRLCSDERRLLNIAPGDRWDVLVKANTPGRWAFHCRILPHAESVHGMFGMVTALVVKPAVA